MEIEEKDIVVLEDGEDYSVCKIIDLGPKKIYFLINLNDLSNRKITYLNNNNRLVEINDKDLIKELKEIASNDIESLKTNIDELIFLIDNLLGEEA